MEKVRTKKSQHCLHYVLSQRSAILIFILKLTNCHKNTTSYQHCTLHITVHVYRKYTMSALFKSFYQHVFSWTPHLQLMAPHQSMSIKIFSTFCKLLICGLFRLFSTRFSTFINQWLLQLTIAQ